MNKDLNREAVLNKARLDKFILILTIPKCMRDIVTSKQIRTSNLINPYSLQFSIFGAPVPTISVPHVDLPFGGQVVKISSMARPTWAPLTVGFTVDNMFMNWWVLWKWSDIINNSLEGVYESSRGAATTTKAIVGTLEDYAANMTVYGGDDFNREVIRFDYKGCFITELGAIEYNYRTPDEITSSFTLQYAQFTSEIIDVQPVVY